VAATVAGWSARSRRRAARGSAGAAAQQQRDRALKELGHAEAVDELMRYVLSESSDKPFTAPELLRRAELLVEARFAARPGQRARLLMTLADLYREVGDNKQAERCWRARSRRSTARRMRRSPRSCTACAPACTATSASCTQAKALLDETWSQLARRHARPRPSWCCTAKGPACSRNLGDTEAMAACAGRAAADRRAASGQMIQAIVLEATMGEAYGLMGDIARAISAHERAIERLRAIGRGHTGIVSTMEHNMAGYLSRAGQQLKATEALARHLEFEGPPGPAARPVVMDQLRPHAGAGGRYDEAAPMLQRALHAFEANGNQRGLPSRGWGSPRWTAAANRCRAARRSWPT
jgi:tetratricopeptide (TPR) repeat protein